jgi:hypothetical protein
MIARLKKDRNIAGVNLKAGTVLEVIPANDERVERVWPGIQQKVGTTAIAVQLPHLYFPIFLHIEEVDLFMV